ncbi:hypothetical protein P886_5039 [Alteromonadaceae bacterium 2753L.S.0a.02]|nr:hypothetical protein P886_5039 [Alteromonadaceae bacterium 2753L.S.0a.02]
MLLSRNLLLMVSFIFLGCYSSFALSGGRYVGKLRPHFWNSSLYLYPVDADKTDVPDCATRELVRLQETDINSSIYAQKYSMILAAWMAGKKMDVRGTGNCTGEGDEIIFAVIPAE